MNLIIIANLLDEESEKKISKYKVVINDGNRDFLVESHIYPEEIDVENNLVTVHAYIRTDDAINNLNKLIIRDYSIEPVPYIQNPIEYYFLPNVVSMKIFVLEKSEDENVVTQYDNILTDSEKQDLYFELDGINILAEIKGVNDPFQRDNISQAKRHVTDFANEN